MDPNCVPTYEGGNPARFCNPDQKNYAGEGIMVNKTGLSYDGRYLCKENYLCGYNTRSTGLLKNLIAINNRKIHYGKITPPSGGLSASPGGLE